MEIFYLKESPFPRPIILVVSICKSSGMYLDHMDHASGTKKFRESKDVHHCCKLRKAFRNSVQSARERPTRLKSVFLVGGFNPSEKY